MKIRIDPLDVLFSKYIRTKAGWKCEMCFKQYTPPTAGLQCSHFKGRRHKATRWDEENCSALCFGCHRKVTEDPEMHRQFFIKRLGQKKYDALVLRSNIGPRPDEKLLKMYYKKKLEDL